MAINKKNKKMIVTNDNHGPLITKDGRQHLEKFFINLFHEKLSYHPIDTSKSHLAKYVLETQTANFIGLVVDCCMIENVNPLIIKNKKDAISIIRERCGILEIKSFLNSIKPVQKLKEVLILSGAEKAIDDLWAYPERSTNLSQTTKKLETLKSDVSDLLYWIRIVNELCTSGNKRLLARFTNLVEVSRFEFVTVFRKDKIFTTLIVSSVLGEIKNEFSFEDIKKFEDLVVKNPEWDKDIGKSFENIFVGSNFANISFAEIPYVQKKVSNIKNFFIPTTIGKLLAVDSSTSRKIIALNNLKSLHFQMFTVREDDSKSGILGSDSFNAVATISSLVENESCLIFEEIFFVEPRLLMFLNKTQLKRLVFANRLHEMFDDDGLRKVFTAADLVTDYEEAVLFADKALSPHVFSKILAEPGNQSILKDIMSYQKIKTVREMSKKVTLSKSNKFSETKKIILKLISLAGKKTKMKPKAYARFLLSLAENSKDVVDEKIITALFLVYPESKLPSYVVEFAKKQEWYELFDEHARRYFAL